jgi:hypothetical protein
MDHYEAASLFNIVINRDVGDVAEIVFEMAEAPRHRRRGKRAADAETKDAKRHCRTARPVRRQ